MTALVGHLCPIGCFSLILWAISPKHDMLLHNVQSSFMSSWTLTSLIEKHTWLLLYPTSGFDTQRVGIAHCLAQQKETQHGRLAVTVETLLIPTMASAGRGSRDRIQLLFAWLSGSSGCCWDCSVQLSTPLASRKSFDLSSEI